MRHASREQPGLERASASTPVVKAVTRHGERRHGVERERTSLDASTELEEGQGNADLLDRQPASLGECVQGPASAMPHDLDQALGGLAWQNLLTGHDTGSFIVDPLIDRVARRPVPTPIRLGLEYHRTWRLCLSKRGH